MILKVSALIGITHLAHIPFAKASHIEKLVAHGVGCMLLLHKGLLGKAFVGTDLVGRESIWNFNIIIKICLSYNPVWCTWPIYLAK